MKSSLKKAIHRLFPPTSSIYFYLWVNFYWRAKLNSIESFLNEFSKENQSFFFLQIGSNDGFHGDPLYKFIRRDQWAGILVEPMDYLFAELKNNYGKLDNVGRLHFENVAISDEEGEKNFYFVLPFTPSKKLPLFLNQQGSFNLDHLKAVKNQYPEIEIGKRTVRCRTVENLVKKYQPEKLDLIHIDTEGHDFTILKSLDLTVLQPKMILYEHRHMTDFQQLEIEKLFQSAGYFVKKEAYDTLVYNLSVGKITYRNRVKELESVEIF